MSTLDYERLTDSDKAVIAVQLGREPRGVLGVLTRCPYGFPQVILNRPVLTEIEDVRVFPTLFWLTCPYLRKEVGRLESEGLVGDFQNRIATDAEFAKAVANNHRSYAALRRNIIPDSVRAHLEKMYPKRYHVLKESGVGGIRNLNGVKCLHTHLADFLVTKSNVIGSEVFKLLDGKTYCSSGICAEENNNESSN